MLGLASLRCKLLEQFQCCKYSANAKSTRNSFVSFFFLLCCYQKHFVSEVLNCTYFLNQSFSAKENTILHFLVVSMSLLSSLKDLKEVSFIKFLLFKLFTNFQMLHCYSIKKLQFIVQKNLKQAKCKKFICVKTLVPVSFYLFIFYGFQSLVNKFCIVSY